MEFFYAITLSTFPEGDIVPVSVCQCCGRSWSQ